jgi:ketosteroid isomerase-like protein
VVSRDFAERFAEEWIAAWNAHDLPRVLSHYEDDFEMASPLIIEVAGEPSGVLRGKKNVGAYWEEALRRSPDLRFEKLGVFIGAGSFAIHFRNQKGRLSVEMFEVGDGGLVERAAAHHGSR